MSSDVVLFQSQTSSAYFDLYLQFQRDRSIQPGMSNTAFAGPGVEPARQPERALLHKQNRLVYGSGDSAPRMHISFRTWLVASETHLIMICITCRFVKFDGRIAILTIAPQASKDSWGCSSDASCCMSTDASAAVGALLNCASICKPPNFSTGSCTRCLMEESA